MPVTPAPRTWVATQDDQEIGFQIDPELLLDFMSRAGLKRSQLADGAKISRPYLTEILKGAKQPREDVIFRLATVLDVHPRALLTRVVRARQCTSTSAGSAA